MSACAKTTFVLTSTVLPKIVFAFNVFLECGHTVFWYINNICEQQNTILPFNNSNGKARLKNLHFISATSGQTTTVLQLSTRKPNITTHFTTFILRTTANITRIEMTKYFKTWALLIQEKVQCSLQTEIIILLMF